MKKLNLFISFLLIFPSFLFAENNILLYMNNGKTINSELRLITDSSFVLVKEVYDEDDDTTKVLRNNIRKVIIPDSSILYAPEIEIHLQDSVIEDIVLTGVDLEHNMIFIANYDYFNDEILQRDTLNLADTNIKMIVVYGESNVATGLFSGGGIGFFGGLIAGWIISGSIDGGLGEMLTVIAIGGLGGIAVGIVAGTIIGIASSSSDMEIDNTHNLKYELLNYIIYPDVIYEPDE